MRETLRKLAVVGAVLLIVFAVTRIDCEGRKVAGAPFTDARDGKTYKTVIIGGKRWMGENLNYLPQTGNSWCYNNKDSKCAKYGRLYDWNTAMTVCPPGWRLPSRQEWGNLVSEAGGTEIAGRKLKAKGDWGLWFFGGIAGNGEDSFGFSALPGGIRWARLEGYFTNAGSSGMWWTAEDSGNGEVYHRYIHCTDDSVGERLFNKRQGISVRCVADK